MREILRCSVGSALKWARPRAGEDAGTWWASPGVRSSLRSSVATRNREEKAVWSLRFANSGGSRGTGREKAVSAHA